MLVIAVLVTPPAAAALSDSPAALSDSLAVLADSPVDLDWRRIAVALRSLDLDDVEAGGQGDSRWLQGVLAGGGAGEIVLVGECEPVSEWRRRACGASFAALEDLRRTPLRHSVRVLLLAGPDAAEEWIGSEMGVEPSEILAVLEFAPEAGDGSSPVLLTLPVATGDGRRLSPGWLVHALLRGGRTVDLAPVVLDAVLSLPAQLIVRAGRTDRRSVAQAFLERGVPAITLTDRSLLTGRSSSVPKAAAVTPAARLLAPAVRRLDTMAARPADEDRYLVFADRVWLRRDLYWIGFAVWVTLVLSGTPGRWRGTAAPGRRAQGRRYLPGFAFRILFLVSLVVTPIVAVPLLVPAALLSAVRAERASVRYLLRIAGVLPILGLAALWWWARAHGTITGYAGTWSDLLLPAATLLAFALGAGLGVAPGRWGRRPTEEQS